MVTPARDTEKPEAKAHYHALSGDHGYMPDNNVTYETITDAADGSAMLFDLTGSERNRLKRDHYLELHKASFGAEYIEIAPCWESDCFETE